MPITPFPIVRNQLIAYNDNEAFQNKIEMSEFGSQRGHQSIRLTALAADQDRSTMCGSAQHRL
jgi:hypothetical protein